MPLVSQITRQAVPGTYFRLEESPRGWSEMVNSEKPSIGRRSFLKSAAALIAAAQSARPRDVSAQNSLAPAVNEGWLALTEEAALEPARMQFTAAARATLSKALALILGPEGVIVCKDVLQLDDAEARKVKRWAIQALVEAAKKQRARH